MRFTILIQYTFCQVQQIAPHSPLAVQSVCAFKTTLFDWLHKYQQPYTIIADSIFKEGINERTLLFIVQTLLHTCCEIWRLEVLRVHKYTIHTFIQTYIHICMCKCVHVYICMDNMYIMYMYNFFLFISICIYIFMMHHTRHLQVYKTCRCMKYNSLPKPKPFFSLVIII